MIPLEFPLKKDCVIALKTQELIPLVFPLKIKGERRNYIYEKGLLPPLLVREGRGGIVFNAIFPMIYTPSNRIQMWVKIQWY